MTKFFSCTLVILLLTQVAQAKLLDKIAAVINDKTYTLSELKDIKRSIEARKEIAGFVYTKSKYNLKDIFYHLRNSYIIRDKLSEQGIIVSDERVEEQINATKKRLGINQKALVSSLRDRGLSFEEYFELTREITEFNYFNRNIIAPLVNITDQEVKNFFYKNSKNKNTFSFEYNLLDYTIAQKGLNRKTINTLPKLIAEYKKSGILTAKLKKLEMNDLGKIAGDDLPKKISTVLRSTAANSYSRPILIGGVYHVFFVKKKELAESAEFKAVKNQIYSKIYFDRSKEITKAWFNREALNYYILRNI